MKTEQLRNIVDNTLVPHSAFNRASDKLEQCFRSVTGASEPISIAIVGESRTGKSRLLEEFAARHPAERRIEGLHMPILRAKAPAQPTVKGLVEVMLRALKDPRADKGTEQARTARLMGLIAAVETIVVMIDEFQHFYDKGTHRVIYHVADWLKNLVDDTKVVLVVAGLPTCTSVIHQNEQLEGRFLAPVRMPRFNWIDDEAREEFTAILGAFTEALSEHFDIPRLDSDEMAFRCYCGTGGLMGYVTKLLRTAVWNAVDSKHRRITLRDLAVAHRESVWNQELLSDVAQPFSRTFETLPRADVLEKISHIGAAAEEAPIERRRPRKRRAPASPQPIRGCAKVGDRKGRHPEA